MCWLKRWMDGLDVDSRPCLGNVKSAVLLYLLYCRKRFAKKLVRRTVQYSEIQRIIRRHTRIRP